MYLKINKKSIKILECNTYKERFKSFKFVLKKIDYGIKIKNKRYASTNFFCQRVDICFTDKDDTIKYLYEFVKSEKVIIKFKKYNIYYLPLDTVKYLKKGDKLKITKSKS